MPTLPRRLTLADAVVIGLGSMVGAGIFAALSPAARAAGSGLLIGLAVAAVIAFCNAIASGRLAALYPQSGGTYVYGRERLGPFWGYLAGWCFVVGKTASCAAMALTAGAYLWPDQARPLAIAAVVALAAVNYLGAHKSATLTKVIVTAVLAILLTTVIVTWSSAFIAPQHLSLPGDTSVYGILQSAGLLFFAFAGYARITTLGEEVRNPARTIPRAITLALTIALVIYTTVAVTALVGLGPQQLASSTAPLADLARVTTGGWLGPIVAGGAALAALGSLLSLILGVSRTTFAMARDHYFPTALAAVHPRNGVPHRAEIAVGVVVVILTATTDLRGVVGFSSFGVLIYYAVANAAAWTLPATDVRSRALPVVGLTGCALLVWFLPLESVIAGLFMVLIGVALYLTLRAVRSTATPTQ